jgi:hypothetical protein
MVPGRNFFTGPLSQRTVRIDAAYGKYNSAQKILQSQGSPQDPHIIIKLRAVENALGFLNRKTESEGDSWSVVGSKTSPRDPWIPLNVLSAFVSYQCQFPWEVWGEFFVHPQGVSVQAAEWYTSMDAQSQTSVHEQSRATVREQIREDQTGKAIGGSVSFNAYDPMVSKGLGVKLKKVKWSDPTTLSDIRYFSPWRLEVVLLGPKGAYAYRTYDWFDHVLTSVDTLQSIVDAYKLPHEEASVFTANLIEENGNLKTMLSTFFDGTASAADWEGVSLSVPRIIPITFFTRDGDASNTVGEDAGYYAKAGALTKPTKVGLTSTFTFPSQEDSAKLRQGISPIAQLFLFYLNNNYSLFKNTMAKILYDTPLVFYTLTGKAWKGALSPSGTSREYLPLPANAPAGTQRKKDPNYLGPGDFSKAQQEYPDLVAQFRRLYRQAWPSSQYVNIPKEVPADVGEALEAESEDYAGTLNPSFIPQTGDPKDNVFEDYPYIIGQGFVCRVTRSVSKQTGSRISSIERAMGVPEVDPRLVSLGKELKQTFRQQRISSFQSLVEKAFITWLEEDTVTGNAMRGPYQESITNAYNNAWSGFFTPDKVPEEAERLGPFAPLYKYNTSKQLGVRTDLSSNPLTKAPYPTAVSDLVTRWKAAARNREGSPTKNKSLYPYQSDAVLRLLDNNGGLLAFDVGVGKTITALAAVGMLKQQGKATRPVFLVPRSIRLKWWKDFQESLPDWRVGVLGMKIDLPTSVAELTPERKREYKRVYKAVVKAPRNASDEEKEELIQTAETVGLEYALGMHGTLKAILSKTFNGFANVPTRLVSRLGGSKEITKELPPVEPGWVSESKADTVVKLENFRDGYYDCLIMDEYNFKSIAISSKDSLSHCVNASPMYAYLFRRGFATMKGGLSKPMKGLTANLGFALKYLGAMDPSSHTTPSDVLYATNHGSGALWPWCPILSHDSPPYAASVLAYVEGAIGGIAGRDVPFGVWGAVGDLFFQKNLRGSRTYHDSAVQAYYGSLLGIDAAYLPGVAAGARLVYVNPKPGTSQEKGDAVFRKLRDSTVTLPAVSPATPLPPGAIGQVAATPTRSAVEVLDRDIANAMGPAAFHYRLQAFYPNLVTTTSPGLYPDGAAIEGFYNYGVISYDQTLPGGMQVVQPVSLGRDPIFEEVLVTNTATDVAQIVADVINVDPAKYGLAGPVMVHEDFGANPPTSKDPTAGDKGYPTPTKNDMGYMKEPGKAGITDKKTLAGYAAKFSALVKTYLSQATPYDEPTITWEDLKVDSFIIDEAHKYKGLFEPDSRGGEVEYLTSGGTSDQAWRMEYLTHTVKARGGQIMLLTATPAKQSPVDFYNIVQLLGSRGIGKDQNLYNLFNINTSEQFISRFVCIQERVIVDSNYQATRGPAATMFGPFDNLLSEFTQIFKRYSDRKTVADAPYLRGDTAATTEKSAYNEAQQAKGLPVWENATWKEGKNILTTYGPSLVKAFASYGLDPEYDEALGISGLNRARLRVLRGDDSGDYRVLNYHSEPTDTKGRYRNTIKVLPAFGGNAGGSMEAQGWSLFVGTKVPIPIIFKPVINMLPTQRELYEDFQRALGKMLAAGTNVRGIRAKIGDKEGVMVLRRDIFATLTRLALHPALQSFTEAFTIEEDDDDDDDDDEETEEEVDPLLKQKKVSQAAAQNFNDGVIMSYRPGIDPDVWETGRTSLGSIIKSQQAFVGANKAKVTEPGNLGWRGKVRILNPEFVSLRNLYKRLSEESSAASTGVAVKTREAGGSPEDIEEAIKAARIGWGETENELGAAGSGKSAERTESTNKETLQDVRTALSPSLSKGERRGVLKYIWNEDAGKPFSAKAISQVKQVAASKAFSGGRAMEGLWALNATSSRTVAISDTVVGQALYDTVNPYMGDVTCGNLIFVNNLMYQAMQLMTLCRVNALAKAAQAELEGYKKFLDGDSPRQNELQEILSWYAIGEQGWVLPFTARSLLNITFPKANIANLTTGNTDPGEPLEKGLHATCKEVRHTLRAIHETAFGTAGGTYEEGDPNTEPTEFTGERYREVVEMVPDCWEWLEGKTSAPNRWDRFGIDPDTIQDAYYQGWANQGSKVCIFNSASAPSGVREALAQLFNGEYEQRIDSNGDTINVALRLPKYDVVLANSVAYEGIDLQTRTCRIIHADLPFTPSDIIQRNGRAVRQGNIYEETQIQAVLAMNTVDYYRIQAIERKRGWLDSALDEGKASYELTNNERELLELATKAVLPEQREQVAERVRGRLEAIEAEEEQRAFSPVINQLTIAAEKQRTININSAADAEVYKTSIAANKKQKQVSVKMASKPTGGCG